jgi:8-oxo-dGTP pyrophosphatase MutT (NUDIX family)
MRIAARALVLDPAGRVLLVRFHFPDQQAPIWAMPGGGVDEGETHEQAIVRELAEEVGLAEFEPGPWIWSREHVFPFYGGGWDGQIERTMLVRVPAFEPQPRFSVEELAAEYVTAVRWWTPAELASSGERFAPAALPGLVAALLRDGPPDEIVDVGV